ncbi:MAG TPA: xanthine dehydrogenase family protein subunit M [Candidatus Binatia bacterium]|jgi:carbon-monoxide dehydrogenase medium subunit
MRRFDLVEPTTLEEACNLIASNDGAKVIAGGTALLNLIKQGVFIPRTLVNLSKIKTTDAITYDEATGLRIDALTKIYDVETSPVVRQHYPVLAETCHLVANIRIRNMATLGGNLAHGDYQSDPPTAFLALDAQVELLSRAQTRQIELAEFLRGSYETALEPDELISAIVVPPATELRGTYIKFTTGSSEERPCAGIAALAHIDAEGVCRELRLVVGAVSTTPVRLKHGESMARGEKLTQGLIERIAADAAQRVDPIDDLRGSADYKRHLVEVLARRALTAATQM